MGTGMTLPAVLKAWLRRGRSLLATTRGAFDLTSVLVGAAVVAILVGGTAVTTFGIIPWAQDNGARQNLSAVNTAQSVAKVRDGKFMTGDGLTGASYLTTSGSALAVGADPSGSCWVGFSRSDAGKTFYSTATKTDPQPWATGTNTGCVDVTQQKQLARAVGTPMPIGYAAGWGANMSQSLGTGSNNAVLAPQEVLRTGVLAGKSMTAIAAGQWHNCGIADGQAYCWGDNSAGQLGTGNTTSSTTPVAVDTSGVLAGKEITAITVGGAFTCALADGAPYCWGQNGWGQLGTGNNNATTVPTAVTGVLAGKKVTSIDAGAYHTCAIADGAAYCWGGGNDGELGSNYVGAINVPRAVSTTGALAGKTVTSIEAGAYFTCAAAGGAAFCWGNGNYGNLGNGSTSYASVPTPVDATGALAGKTVTKVAVGLVACALADSKPYCWGTAPNGGLGAGTGTTTSYVPVAVAPGDLQGKAVSDIAIGSGPCVLAESDLYCWGNGSVGANGTNTTANAYEPAKVVVQGSLAGKKAIAVNRYGDSGMAIYE